MSTNTLQLCNATCKNILKNEEKIKDFHLIFWFSFRSTKSGPKPSTKLTFLRFSRSYWEDKDTALLILEQLYKDIPVDPKSEEISLKTERRAARRRSTSSVSQVEFDFEEDDGIALTFQSGGKMALALAEAFRMSIMADPLRVKNWGLAL